MGMNVQECDNRKAIDRQTDRRTMQHRAKNTLLNGVVSYSLHSQ